MSAVRAEGLTPELLDLMEHEKVIEQGLASFVDVGCALLAIKAGKKYRHAGYDTFETYCRERWDISRNYGHRLVVAASVAGELLPMGNIPTPESERQIRPLVALPTPEDRREAWADAVSDADGDQPTAAQVERAVAKRQPPKREHPAPFSNDIIDLAADKVRGAATVLDPFAGTGRVHELRDKAGVTTTIGVEIEDWPNEHPDNTRGSALDLAAAGVAAASVDAVVTSPTYGNRMADHHDAKDDSVRLTYKHTLGYDLADDNSGQLQWGDEYRDFHRRAWAEAVNALKPGGTFVLNIKNHIRDHELQRVAEWHVNTLMHGHDLELVAWDFVMTRGLPAGANANVRATPLEWVITFRKPVTR